MTRIVNYNDKFYKVTDDGTYYHYETSDEVVQVLQQVRLNHRRIRLAYGDRTIGRSWLEENGIEGTVSRSMGPIKIPILVFNSRSHGGGGILTHCVVKVTLTASGLCLYQHDRFSLPSVQWRQTEPVGDIDRRTYPIEVLVEDKRGLMRVHARFQSLSVAKRWANKVGVTSPVASLTPIGV